MRGAGSSGFPAPGPTQEVEAGRVQAFADGVLAVIIPIRALELRAPAVHGVVGLAAAGAWVLLVQAIVRAAGPGSKVRTALRTDVTGGLQSRPTPSGRARIRSLCIADAFYAAISAMSSVADRRLVPT